MSGFPARLSCPLCPGAVLGQEIVPPSPSSLLPPHGRLGTKNDKQHKWRSDHIPRIRAEWKQLKISPRRFRTKKSFLPKIALSLLTTCTDLTFFSNLIIRGSHNVHFEPRTLNLERFITQYRILHPDSRARTGTLDEKGINFPISPPSAFLLHHHPPLSCIYPTRTL